MCDVCIGGWRCTLVRFCTTSPLREAYLPSRATTHSRYGLQQGTCLGNLPAVFDILLPHGEQQQVRGGAKHASFTLDVGQCFTGVWRMVQRWTSSVTYNKHVKYVCLALPPPLPHQQATHPQSNSLLVHIFTPSLAL